MYIHVYLLSYSTLLCLLFLCRDFYPEIGLPAPSDEEMLETLRKSVKLSRDRHYTGDKGITVLSPEGVCVCVCVCARAHACVWQHV